MVFQAAHGHVLVDQEPLIAIGAVANQGNKIRVVKQAQHQNLHNEFLKPLKPVVVKLLNCNNLSHNVKKKDKCYTA